MNTISMISRHFKRGGTLTKLQCIKKYGYINLGDVVYKLRSEGQKIETEMLKNKNGKKYAVYKGVKDD